MYVHLKLRPNIGIVGFPNAGKSTLLKALVPEKSIEVSSTQFTTKHPQVCYVKFDGEEAKLRSNGCKTEVYSFTMAQSSNPFSFPISLRVLALTPSQRQKVFHRPLKPHANEKRNRFTILYSLRTFHSRSPIFLG